MPYVRFLDGLRCLSVAWVILHHLPFEKTGALGLLSGRGWMGVDMFFVISGFLITGILLNERRSAGAINLKNFYIRRALRIWPAYYLLICCYLLVGVLVSIFGVPGLIATAQQIFHTVQWAATYTSNAYIAFANTEDITISHSWSLALEEQFYLLWPLLLATGVTIATRTAIVAIVAMTAWRVWLTLHYPEGALAMRRIYFAPDTRMDVILYGALLALALSSDRWKPRLRRLLSLPGTPIGLMTALLVVMYFANRWSGFFGNSFGYGCSALLMSLTLGYLFLARPPFVLRALENQHVVACGRISYGMYLYHAGVINILLYMRGMPTTWSAKLVFTALTYTITIGVAALSYRYFESPLLKLKSRFSAGAAAAPATAPVNTAGAAL
jgi:peptidoglycan/LPS O-acetylase OafA/YrhL